MNTTKLVPSRSVLVVVDVQERLAPAMPDAGAACIAAIDLLLEGAQLLGVEVLVSEQYPKGLGPTVAPLRERLGDHAPLEKIAFDATADEGIAARLEALRAAGRTHALVCGMEAHICVYQTARGLVDRGWHTQVIGDATSARSESNRALAPSLWRAAGAMVTGTETVLFDWLGVAGTDAFKTLSKRLR